MPKNVIGSWRSFSLSALLSLQPALDPLEFLRHCIFIQFSIGARPQEGHKVVSMVRGSNRMYCRTRRPFLRNFHSGTLTDFRPLISARNRLRMPTASTHSACHSTGRVSVRYMS
jgi:hypothetical protein